MPRSKPFCDRVNSSTFANAKNTLLETLSRPNKNGIMTKSPLMQETDCIRGDFV